MGGLFTKEDKLDISPSALNSTSLDDKNWLNVNAESIFNNDSFTNEKYYMLVQSGDTGRSVANRHNSLYETQENPRVLQNNNIPNVSHLPVSSHRRKISEEEVMEAFYKRNQTTLKVAYEKYDDVKKIITIIVAGLIDKENFFHEIAVDTLLQELSVFYESRKEYFDSIIQKRLSILKRIHIAIHRENARHRLLEISGSLPHPKLEKQLYSNVLTISIKILLSTIRSLQSLNPEVSQEALKTLHDVLMSLPPLSLASEPAACVDSFRSWIQWSFTKSKATEVQKLALECLIGLSISRGSLFDILTAADLLLTSLHSNDPKKPSTQLDDADDLEVEEESLLNVTPFLRKLNNWNVDLKLSPIHSNLLNGTWTLNWSDSITDSKSLSFLTDPHDIATVTTDGTFLYLHDTCGLVKIGTGCGGTMQGKVYLRYADWYNEEKGWLLCIHDKLYYRSPSIAPATFVVLDSGNFSVLGHIMKDGNGSLKTLNNSNIPFGPEAQQEDSPEALIKSINREGQPVIIRSHTSGRYIDRLDLSCTTGKRSPSFTDGRFVYILSHLNFLEVRYSKFVVDVYDPYNDMLHMKHIVLYFRESEMSPLLYAVLSPNSLEHLGYYTNGQYLMVIIPAPFASEYGYDATENLSRCFELSTGELVSNQTINIQVSQLGLCTQYDYRNNVIWCYSNAEMEISRYMNDGISPKFSTDSSGFEQDKVLIESMLPENDGPIPPMDVIDILLGVVSRLSKDSMPLDLDMNVKETYPYVQISPPRFNGKEYTFESLEQNVSLLKEPFCVEIDSRVFAILLKIMEFSRHGYYIDSESKQKTHLQVIISCLRILKVNVHRLVSNQINPTDIDLSPPPISIDYNNEDLANNSSGNLILDIRNLLRHFVSMESKATLNQSNLLSEIQKEACDTLTMGLQVFYPTFHEQSLLLLRLLNESESNITGAKIFLEPFFRFLSQHKTPSYLVLPPSSEELDAFSTHKIVELSSEWESDESFDTLHLFIPIISRLLKEAQTAHKSGYSNSDIMAALLAIQKDLLLRAERGENNSKPDQPKRALVVYIKLVINQTLEFLRGILQVPNNATKIDMVERVMDDIRYSVSGTLLPTLVHSLFLFSHNCWLAKHILPSIIEIISTVDSLNQLLPSDFSLNQSLNAMTPRNEFVEGPSQVIETPHPYPKSMDTNQIVKIEGAIFLTLIFDERCSTEPRDFLQLFNDESRTRPIGEKYSGDNASWPKRRILIPGDTVVFNFHSEGPLVHRSQSTSHIGNVPVPSTTRTMSNDSNVILTRKLFGYRCVIIGNMPNNKKAVPWSVQFVKTLCCLGGQLSGALISGDALSDLEIQYDEKVDKIISYGLTDKGCSLYIPDIEYVEGDLESSMNAAPDKDRKRKDKKIKKKESLGRHTSEEYLFDYSYADETKFEKDRLFCESFVEMKDLGAVFAVWMHEKFGSRIPQRESIKKAERAAIASIMYLCGYTDDVIFFVNSLTRRATEEDKTLESKLKKVRAKMSALCDNCRLIREGIIRKHQKLMATIPSDSKGDRTFYQDICQNVLSKARFFMFLRRSKRNNKKQSMQSLIVNLLLDDVTLDVMVDIIRRRRDRAIQRSFGLDFMNGIMHSTSYCATRYEALYFLGPSLKNSGSIVRQWPHHYLDHTSGSEPYLKRTVSLSFQKLTKVLLEILKDNMADDALRLLVLDSIVLSYQVIDHGFLHDVDIFNVLYKISMETKATSNIYIGRSDKTYDSSEKLGHMCQSVFKLLAVTCIGGCAIDDTKDPIGHEKIVMTESSRLLYDSFFRLVARQLELAIENLKESKSIVFYKRSDLLEVLSLIYTLSVSPIVKKQLSTPRFIHIFYSLIQIRGDAKARSIILRLFRRILPSVNSPNSLYLEKDHLMGLPYLFCEIVGVIYCWTFDDNDVVPKDTPYKNIIASVYQMNFPFYTSNRKLFSKSVTGKLCLSHPFFPFYDVNLVLPIGWETKDQNPSVRISNDSRTVTLVGIPSNALDDAENAQTSLENLENRMNVDMERNILNTTRNEPHVSEVDDSIPYAVIRSDHPIPEDVPLFYFEVRVEDVGNDPGNIAIGLHPTDQRLNGLPGWYNGSYGYHSDGRKYKPYMEPNDGLVYAPAFTKNDIIGCCFVKKTGSIFFTKNGEYLGVAFKNVKGSYYPVVGLTSPGSSVAVNFGQMPFRFDIAPKLEDLRHDFTTQNANQGYEIMSVAREIISLLRCLMKKKSWRTSIVEYIVGSLNGLPDFLAKLCDNKECDQELIRLISSLSILGGSFEDVHTGCVVEVYKQGQNLERGIVVEYDVGSAYATVVLGKHKPHDSREAVENMIPLKIALSDLRVVQDFPLDNLFKEVMTQVIESISLFLRFTQAHKIKKQLIYYRVKSLLFKMLSNAVRIEEVVELLLKNGCVPLIIDLAIHSTRESPNLNSSYLSGTEHLQRLERLSSVVIQKQFEINAPIYLKKYNVDVQEEEDESSSDSYSKSDSIMPLSDSSDPSPDLTSSSPSFGLEFLEDLHSSAFGRLVRWNDVNIGMTLMVWKREKKKPNINYVSDWVEAMNDTVGKTGVVIEMDSKTQQVLLRIVDPVQGSFEEWWYSIRVLIISHQPSSNDIDSVLSYVPNKQPSKVQNVVPNSMTSQSPIATPVSPSNSNTPSTPVTKSKFSSPGNPLTDSQNQITSPMLTQPTTTLSTSFNGIQTKEDFYAISVQTEQRKCSFLTQAMLLEIFSSSPLHLKSIKEFGGPSHLIFILKLASSFHNTLNIHDYDLTNPLKTSIIGSLQVSTVKLITSGPATRELLDVLKRLSQIIELDSNSSMDNASREIGNVITQPGGTIHLRDKEREIHKGYLIKQGKMFKQRKKYWFVISETELYYYKSEVHESLSQPPLGHIYLRDIVSIETEKKRKEIEFNVVTTNKTYSFQALSLEEKDIWMSFITQQAQYCRIHQLHPSTDSIVTAFANECVVHLKESLQNDPLSSGLQSSIANMSSHASVMMEQCLHPYKKMKYKKMVLVERAKNILIVFDQRSRIRSGVNILRLYRDISCTDLIASYSGKGPSSFHPIIIPEADKFWFVFHCESDVLGGEKEEEWGFRFYASNYTSHPYPYSIVSRYSFEFAMILTQWLLDMDAVYIKRIENSIREIFSLLASHVELRNHPYDHKIRIIISLTRLVRRCHELSYDGDWLIRHHGVLDTLEGEMFSLYTEEKKLGTDHSLYFQMLFELVVQIHRARSFDEDSYTYEHDYIQTVQETIKNPSERVASSSPPQTTVSSITDYSSDSYESDSLDNKEINPHLKILRDEERRKRLEEDTKKRRLEEDKKKKQDKEEEEKKKKIEEEKKRKQEEEEKRRKIEDEKKKRLEKDKKKKDKKKDKRTEDRSWFDQAYSCIRTIERLSRGDVFTPEFISDSLLFSRQLAVVEESPHPYPHGVRVTSRVQCPNATQLRVSFDARSRTELNCDYLMFSRDNVGGDDLGFFSGHFPTEEIVIQGDNFVWSFLSDSSGEGNFWGFRFSVTPIFLDEYKEEIKANCEEEYRQNRKLDIGWTRFVDSQFVRFINSNCERLRISSQDISFEKCDLDEVYLYPKLIGIPPIALKRRLFVIKYFNFLIEKIFTLLDFSVSPYCWSLSWLLCEVKSIIFYDNKLNLLNNCLVSTQSFLNKSLVILNRRIHTNNTKSDATAQLFYQGWYHLNFIDPVRLRQPERAWEVHFENEGAEDAGGPYRESLTQFCQDLHKEGLELLIETPNQRNKVGFHQDKFIPNPNTSASDEISKFEFLGKLMGIAIRTRQVLDLNLPSIVWKRLVGSSVDRSDLEAIDLQCCNYLDSVMEVDQEESESIFETFTISTVDGKVVALKENGKNIKVTWENRAEFYFLAEKFKLNELNRQIDAMKRGIYSIVPTHIYVLFTWKELELRVCGRPGVDLKLLKKNTVYHPNLNERLVVDFWTALESFSSEEQTLFLRFVWGRSRLPTGSDFSTKFQIHPFIKSYSDNMEEHMNNMTLSDDAYLPQALTCFFTLCLPAYSSYGILRDKLLYAINTCQEIDTDF